MAGLRREGHDVRAHTQGWERYVALLCRAVENATISSYGRQYPAVFWLQHSLDVARLLKDVPKRILRRDSEIGRRHGDAIKYRILDRFLDRVLSATIYDLMQRLAGATEEVEEELFPRLLTRMRDNVLLFTEDYIGRDLGELTSYFNGSLAIDGRDLRRRLDELARWHFEQLATDPGLRAAVVHLLTRRPAQRRPRPAHAPRLRRLSWRPSRGTTRRGCCRRRWSQVWESLLVKLKEFELVHALRRLIVPIEVRDGADVRLRAGGRAGGGPARRRAAPVGRHPAARLHGALGGRSARRALRDDLRHQRLLGHPLAPPPRRQRQPGRRLPRHVPLPAADQPPRASPTAPSSRSTWATAPSTPAARRPTCCSARSTSSATTWRRCARGSPSTAACASPSTTAPTA